MELKANKNLMVLEFFHFHYIVNPIFSELRVNLFIASQTTAAFKVVMKVLWFLLFV